MDQAVQTAQAFFLRWQLAKLLIDELETLGRGCHADAILQPIGFMAQAGDDFAPRLLSLYAGHHVQFIDESFPDFEADDTAGHFHTATENCASILAARREVNFLVRLVDFYGQPPIVGNLLDRRVKDIPNHGVCRGEVSGIHAGPFPCVFADISAACPCLAGAKPCY